MCSQTYTPPTTCLFCQVAVNLYIGCCETSGCMWPNNRDLQSTIKPKQDSYFRPISWSFILCVNSTFEENSSDTSTPRAWWQSHAAKIAGPGSDAGSSEPLCQNLQPQPAPLGDEPQAFYHLQLGFENNQISISPPCSSPDRFQMGDCSARQTNHEEGRHVIAYRHGCQS